MKKNVPLLIISILLGVLALACSGVISGLLGFESVFDTVIVSDAIDCFKFQTLNANTLVVTISFALSIIFFVVLLVLLIVKKRPVALIPLFLCAAGLSLGAYSFIACYTIVAEPALIHVILLYSALGLSVVGLILLTFFLLLKVKEEPKEEAKPAPSMDGAVEIVYESDSQPKDYAEDEEKRTPEAESEEKAAPAAAEEADQPAEPTKEEVNKPNKTLGKYEVFPEAGFFKYRLKANNGEILLASNGYRTRDGARAGIATLKRNVPGGNAKIITDKNGFSQFRIYTSNDSRLVVAGEFYSSAVNAQKALKSVNRFYSNDKIIDLEEIPEAEVREWKVDLPPINPNKNGKFEVFIDEDSKKWQGRLIASNGAVLFVTSTYSSKNAVMNAYGNIQNKVLEGDLSIARDKQNRYQFRVISENGSIILMGETYPSRDSAISAVVSVRNFIGNARIVDLTRSV